MEIPLDPAGEEDTMRHGEDAPEAWLKKIRRSVEDFFVRMIWGSQSHFGTYTLPMAAMSSLICNHSTNKHFFINRCCQTLRNEIEMRIGFFVHFSRRPLVTFLYGKPRAKRPHGFRETMCPTDSGQIEARMALRSHMQVVFHNYAEVIIYIA